MAATYAVSDLAVAVPNQPRSVGAERSVVKLLTASGTYTTGGDAITAASLGLTRILHGTVAVHTADASAVVQAVLVPTATGALVKLNAAAAEVANATDVAGLVLQVQAYGFA